MKKFSCVLALALVLGIDGAHASADLAGGSFYRTASVPAWSPESGSFTIMLWVYAPGITGTTDYFNADDGGSSAVVVNLGSAADSPTEPYVFTRNGEWHFNKDGTYVAKPAQSFDVTAGWTFLAISFTTHGANDLYAWQAGVNNGALVHIPVASTGATIGGTGVISTFMMGNESALDHVCRCLLGPVYVYDGSALTQAQIDAQRQQLAPVTQSHLIAFSSFSGARSLAADESGTADWSVRGSPALSGDNPPVVQGVSPGSGGGAGSFGGIDRAGAGGALGLLGLMLLLVGALGRRALTALR